MNREIWRLGWRSLKQKSTFFISFFWITGFFWIYGTISDSMWLNKEKKRSLEVICEISASVDNKLKDLRQLDGIEFLSRWEESTQILEWKGYQAEVQLIGVDQEYLDTYFFGMTGRKLSETMPSLLVENSIFSVMKNENGEKMTRYGEKEFLYQWVKINQTNARIYGVLEEPDELQIKDNGKDEKRIYRVYTLADVYERIVLKKELQEETIGEQTLSYLLGVTDTVAWQKIRPVFEQYGILLKNSAELDEMETQLRTRREGMHLKVLLSLGVWMSGILLFHMQRSLWRKEHSAFIQYLRSMEEGDKAWRKLKRCEFWILSLVGSVGGAIIFVVRMYML